MNATIAKGFIEQLEKTKLNLWTLVQISDAVAACWPEWRIRYNWFSNRAMELNYVEKADDSEFEKLNKQHEKELSEFLKSQTTP